MLKNALDVIDLKILNILQEDATISNVDLSKKIDLSPSPCLVRVKRLEKRGFIKKYVTLIDPVKVGLKVTVFIHVTLEKQIETALEIFEKEISDKPEVMECYLMTGESDYLLRVIVDDLQSLEKFILNFMTKIPGVGNIKSSFALKQVKYKTVLPIS